MKILFIHQNMPGQYKHLAARLAQGTENQVAFITKRKNVDIPGVRRLNYEPSRGAHASTHPYLRQMENAVLYGQGAVRSMMQLKQEGFIPDIIVGHPGWGELLYAKDTFPRTPLLSYCEFYYRGTGADIDFDPEFPASADSVLSARTRNSHLLLGLEACDQGISPTEWQRSVHPRVFHPKIAVVHDGIDTAVAQPNPDASVTLPDGRVLTRNDEVVTYVARNLEPYRGFLPFMRSLPHLLEARPNAHVLIVGGDELSYGSGPKEAPNWREKMLAEVPVDSSRVTFLGRVPYGQFLSILQVSSAHIYLTYPFVLSWSMIEAMAIGCTLVASRTKPVEEVITHGENGLLVDFFNPEALARQVTEVLANRAEFARLGVNARRTVLRKYDLTLCLKQQMKLITGLVRGTR